MNTKSYGFHLDRNPVNKIVNTEKVNKEIIRIIRKIFLKKYNKFLYVRFME